MDQLNDIINIFILQKQLMIKEQIDESFNSNQKIAPLLILIMEFWISGLFIMSVIFTEKDPQILNLLNFWMFVSVGVGSLIGGILSDFFNRIAVFYLFSIILVISSILIIFFPFAGYILAGASIGPLNNLTFVIIYEKYPQKSQLYTSFVLMGWAGSQVTLGLLFFFIQPPIFYFFLTASTIVYLVATLLFFEKNQELSSQQNSLLQREQSKNNQQSSQCDCLRLIIPSSIKPLIGGCIFMFVMQMFYYRIQFTLDEFGVSLELNNIVVGVTELIANLILTQLLYRIPRKLFLRILILLLMGLYFLLILVENKIMQTVLEGCMRVVTTSIMITLGVFLPELFFQHERSKGTNYIMSFGVLGSALNGIVLSKLSNWELEFFLVAAWASTFLLHETFDSKNKKASEQL